MNQEHVNQCLDIAIACGDPPVTTDAEINDRMVCDLPLPTSFTSRPTVTQPSPTSASVHPPAYNYSTIVDYTLNLDIIHSEIPTKFSRAPRTCPFYKRMPHSNFAIDAFSYGRIPDCTSYFLTHFHADHYGGLTSTFNHGPIYCSAVTANLVIHKLGVNSQWVRVLPLNQPVLIGEARVTLFEANHCPGSVLFFFDIPLPSPATAARSFKILHTGDFRACPAQCLNPYIKDTQLDALYLDTTYLDPTYAFPPQREVIEAVAHWCQQLQHNTSFRTATFTGSNQPRTGRSHAATSMLRLDTWFKSNNTSTAMDVVQAPPPTVKSPASVSTGLPRQSTLGTLFNGTMISFTKAPKHRLDDRLLFVVGTYTIGKERIFASIAEALDSKVYVDYPKKRILRCLEDPALWARLTDRAADAQVHVTAMNRITKLHMEAYLRENPAFTHLVAIKPTGWTFACRGLPRRRSDDRTGIGIGSRASNGDLSAKSTPTNGPPLKVSLITEFMAPQKALASTGDNSPLGHTAGTGLPLGAHGNVSGNSGHGELQPPIDIIPPAGEAFTMEHPTPISRSSNLLIMGVPYSEHSSFRELAAFVLSIQVKQIIPTVNVGDPARREEMRVWLDKWQAYKKHSGVQRIPVRQDYW
ncbi:repair protein PSO2 SNM1 [Dimargaris cristalligena]|nr:repair protein PSO2 SNM1 [Dimargaris cristalligena]